MFDKKKDATVEPGKGADPKEKPEKTAERQIVAIGEVSEPEAPAKKKTAKSRKRLKRIVFSLLVFIVLSGAGFAGYSFFLKGKTDQHYVEQKLSHVTLPPEMMRFCFENLPGLYEGFQRFSLELTQIDREIQRIEAIASAYPDQSAIANREKRIWTGTRNKGFQNFTKIEKQVRQIYVTFQVNPETGTTRLDQEGPDLVQRITEILEPVTALTQRIQTAEQAPAQGWIRKTISKLKHLFA